MKQLRVLYHDWCSAHLAERFLQLSPEEVYELAEQAVHSPAELVSSGRAAVGAMSPAAAAASGDDTVAGSYRDLVGQVAELLSTRVGLPTFEEWVAAYEVDPGRFEADIIGFARG